MTDANKPRRRETGADRGLALAPMAAAAENIVDQVFCAGGAGLGSR